MFRNPPGGDVPATAYNLFILEDHATMRRMLRLFAEESGMNVSGEAVSGEEALATTLPDEADLVLVDLSLPGMNGLEFIQKLYRRCPDCRCLVVSAHTEPFYAEAARKAGAVGFVTKDDPDSILAAIRGVLETVRHSAWPPCISSGGALKPPL